MQLTKVLSSLIYIEGFNSKRKWPNQTWLPTPQSLQMLTKPTHRWTPSAIRRLRLKNHRLRLWKKLSRTSGGLLSSNALTVMSSRGTTMRQTWGFTFFITTKSIGWRGWVCLFVFSYHFGVFLSLISKKIHKLILNKHISINRLF